MITVQQATDIIASRPFIPGVSSVDLLTSVGRVLAEEVKSDRDLPPFHRATMDGIAISFAVYQKGIREFIIDGVQPAGQPQIHSKDNTHCVEIMTGAVLPDIFDTVVRYEDVSVSNGKAVINIDSVESGQSIHRKGIDASKGEVLLKPGTLITPAEVALLASVGKSTVSVYKIKPIAIVSTGDELVPIEATPKTWEIRRSNGVALAAALRSMHIDTNIYHLPDVPEQLETELTKILQQHDVVILSGGVSKGKFDFVPDTLTKLGVVKQFHQVKQRPGKPFWFGRNETKTVFALPGNPVSTFLCFYKYIHPWILSGLGIINKQVSATLASDYKFKPDLTYFLQVKVDSSQGIISATPDAGEGSGDFANLRNVDGFIELPSERSTFNKGETFPYIPFRA